MKRAKSTRLKAIAYMATKYEYTCPHCKTMFTDFNIFREVSRVHCSHCKNEIIFIWPKESEDKK
jgi:predicted SprT family Zn-dependent metalloprotease